MMDGCLIPIPLLLVLLDGKSLILSLLCLEFPGLSLPTQILQLHPTLLKMLTKDVEAPIHEPIDADKGKR